MTDNPLEGEDNSFPGPDRTSIFSACFEFGYPGKPARSSAVYHQDCPWKVWTKRGELDKGDKLQEEEVRRVSD